MQVDTQTYRPIIYKGHGMLEKASSYNANAHVVNHERHHLQQYRAIAMATGKEVVCENISIQYQFVDGKLIPVKGEASAVLKQKEAKPDTLEIEFGSMERGGNQDQKTEASPQNNTDQKIERIENRIESQLEKVKGKISELESEDDSGFKLASIQNKENQLEQIRSKIESLKSGLEMESGGQAMNDLLEKIGNAVMSPQKLLEAIMGVKTGETDEINTTSSSHAASEKDERAYNRNMDYSLQALAMSASWVA